MGFCLPEQRFACLDAVLEQVQAAWERWTRWMSRRKTRLGGYAINSNDGRVDFVETPSKNGGESTEANARDVVEGR